MVVACIWGVLPRSSYLNASWLKIRLRSRSRRDGEPCQRRPAADSRDRVAAPASVPMDGDLLRDGLGRLRAAGVLQDRLGRRLGEKGVAAIRHVQAVGGEPPLRG